MLLGEYKQFSTKLAHGSLDKEVTHSSCCKSPTVLADPISALIEAHWLWYLNHHVDDDDPSIPHLSSN